MFLSKKINVTTSAILIFLTVFYFLETSFGDHEYLPFSSRLESRKNVAVIIEDRPLDNITPLLLHFSSVLGPEWPIVLYTSQLSHPNSTALRRAIKENRISIRNLPDDVEFTKHESVSSFLTQPWFWEQLAPAQHVLLFQADSIICSNSETRIEDFLEYDFVGAPILKGRNFLNGHGEGFNGGFSLRNRAMILDIIGKHSWQGERDSGEISQAGCVTQAPCLKFEDQWFYHKMKTMSEARLPSQEVASMFAVETIWHDSPLGYHQVERWNKEKMDKVAAWCPEYAMATSDLLVKHS